MNSEKITKLFTLLTYLRSEMTSEEFKHFNLLYELYIKCIITNDFSGCEGIEEGLVELLHRVVNRVIN
jgi:hypothetical protein